MIEAVEGYMTLSASLPPLAGPQPDGAAPASAPEEVYRARCARFARERDALARRWNRVANWRLLAFLAAVVCLGWGIWRRAPVPVGAAIPLFALFGVLVAYHRRLGRRRRRADELWRINDEALKRLARDWEALPLRHSTRAEPGHPYAADLDLFGRASLFHLVQPEGTGPGEATLSRWLLGPAPPETVRERQAAVAELAPLIDLRDELALRGRLMGDAPPDPEPLLRWAEGGRWLARRRWLLWGARLSPPLFWATAIAQVVGIVPLPLWLLPLGANLLLSRAAAGGTRGVIEPVAGRAGALDAYAGSFGLLSAARFNAPMLGAVQARLTADGATAQEQARRLRRLAGLAIPRSAIVYGILQALTLWDIHLLAALERWQAVAGGRARDWLAALGDAEALAALAGLAHDNPGWAFPDLDPRAPALAARGLGHPLLPPDARVDNDVEVGPPGTFLLVTGSNMSGKSTLLRAIGVNIVLAGAGGPVCARELRLPPVALWTAMRVQDSLERGVSYFMAELQRLKAVVDAARRENERGER
ncbi:MAG: DNA mismatch repair protein MutS, partial [Chloroflexota bacterium]|nr:DNA mismatch repair protein MutS [Chloroflexota bacterium]